MPPPLVRSRGDGIYANPLPALSQRTATPAALPQPAEGQKTCPAYPRTAVVTVLYHAAGPRIKQKAPLLCFL